MLKNFLILGGTAFAVYWLLMRPQNAVAADTGAAGRSTVTTTGKPVTLYQGKDGFIYDQYGGMWA